MILVTSAGASAEADSLGAADGLTAADCDGDSDGDGELPELLSFSAPHAANVSVRVKAATAKLVFFMRMDPSAFLFVFKLIIPSG